MNAEDRWLAGLRQGEPSAYETLVDGFEQPLYRYFLASHGDPQRAGEQSADCFGDLVSALPRMKGGPNQLRAFVFGVARNVLRQGWRRDQHRAAPLGAAYDLTHQGPSPLVTAEDREELSRLFEAMYQLSPKIREVFVLRYVEQLSLDEVAQVTGAQPGTIRNHLHRGRSKLEKLLGKVGQI